MNMEVQRSPVFSPRMVLNHAGQPCYLVEYDEDQWLKYDKAGQEHCFETWAKKAKPMGAQFVVLRLIPDPLFPSGDKTIPYAARSYPVDQETFNPITVTVTLKAQIHPDTYLNALDGERMKLTAAARVQLGMAALGSKGCSYEIWTRGIDGAPFVIERGRL
jgi:hypothetical protein